MNTLPICWPPSRPAHTDVIHRTLIMKTILPLLLIVLLIGCIPIKDFSIAKNELLSMKSQSITTSKRDTPTFGVASATKTGLGPIGLVAMMVSSNDIIQKNNIEDSAVYISRELTSILIKHYQMNLLDVEKKVDGESTIEISKTYKDADYILDVETRSWSIEHFLLDWNSYRVVYSARLRLIDTRNKILLAKGFYCHIPKHDKSAPSRDDMLMNNAQRLKDELKIAADLCIKYFKSEILKL